ncbi:uncharacterized protein LOC130993201 isoform X3 [Salvia miltiorrhiza]|uniref:uncharacterized protein LOC130993201 isoform X3 n=1 Tax=Salvia miltiorrhiza TaxID=226208 RepID=UPI0025AB6071|nr:uncharacterized protein LOC130993201 isoform X3 [Salvia miltiorrhiza]
MCVCMTDFNRCGLLLLAAALSLFCSHTVYCDGGGHAEVQWQILTKLNYSSQIRLHPRLLLLVTVPWSGESRSLMKGLAHAVARDEMGLGTLKLMVLYKNVERTLADALDATDGITVFYYHNSLSYKYWGRLRVQSILVSVHYVMQLSPDEQPLKSLTTAEELREFLHSTDKAVLLFDLCGWTPRLVAMNESTTGSDLGKGFVGADSKMENNGTLVGEEKDNRKDVEDDMPSCGRDEGFSGPFWTNQFSTVNNSLLKEVENVTVSAGESCSLFELQRYKVSFQKFIEVAREFFLPPEKYRYAVVRERSLLPLLNVEEPILGLVTVQFAGCPSCSQVLKEVDDLKAILQSQPSPVSEVRDDPHGVDAVLPTKRPSMLLFIDRSSNSIEIRRESQEALNAFRELAEHTQMPNQIHGQAITRPDKTLDTHKHPRLQHFALSEKSVLEDKMSITIMNDGQQVTLENLVSNLQGLMSVQEILTYALKKKAERKLSSLAKDVGFQLLSKDFDIEVVEHQPPHVEDQSDLASRETPVEDYHEGVDIDKKIPADDSDRRPNVVSSPSDVEYIVSEGKEDDSNILSSVEPEQGDADESDRGPTESDRRPNDVVSSPSDVEYIVSEGKEDDSNILSSVEPEQGDADESDRRPNAVSSPSDVEYMVSEGKEDCSNILSSVEPEQGDDSLSITADSAQGLNVRETAHSGLEDNEQHTNFNVSFFLFDGQYRLLETLTGGLNVPSVVIVDPISENHYVLDEQSVLSYSSLSLFVNDFLAGKLHPYLQSSTIVPSLRGAQRPPFVNQGFHETDSIPLVTTHTFSELVLGNKSDPRNSASPWDRNVLVLFSNNWCGFCQRMEFVVREVYRAVKSYAYMKTNSSRKDKLVMAAEHTLDVVLKLPLIYMMDCTRNDCGFIIRPILQREVYPLLLLFPAERKNETISYEGDIIVSDIIKFLAAHGSHVIDLITNRDFLQDQKSVEEELQTRNSHHEVLLKDLVQNVAVKYKIDAQLSSKLQEKPQLSVGCVLSATEKLLDVHPFDESKILIVNVDEKSGFRGLIINKHIGWDSLEELGEGSFEYLKEAPLSFGGPVMMRGMPLAALTHKFFEGRSLEVLPNFYLMDQLAMPGLVEDIRAGNQSVGDFWFFLGYSSWGWEQLYTEIAQGAWNVSKGDLEQLEWPWR